MIAQTKYGVLDLEENDDNDDNDDDNNNKSSAHLQMSQLANKAAMSESRTVYTARTLKKQ